MLIEFRGMLISWIDHKGVCVFWTQQKRVKYSAWENGPWHPSNYIQGKTGIQFFYQIQKTQKMLILGIFGVVLIFRANSSFKFRVSKVMKLPKARIR